MNKRIILYVLTSYKLQHWPFSLNPLASEYCYRHHLPNNGIVNLASDTERKWTEKEMSNYSAFVEVDFCILVDLELLKFSFRQFVETLPCIWFTGMFEFGIA